MELTEFATELLLQIFYSCGSMTDALNLGATCHRLHRVSKFPNRLPILYAAAEAQLGPVHDAIRLVTQNASQPVHLPRPAPPQSLALLQRLLTVGRVANEFILIYPAHKWPGPYSNCRRLLTSSEAYHLRRAIYRLWLYTKAFHTPSYTRRTRLQPPTVRSRAALLRPFPASELAEILDAHAILRALLASYICPSDATVRRRYAGRHSHNSDRTTSTSASSNMISTLFLELEYQTDFHHSSPFSSMKRTDPSLWAALGWGDEIAHYYVVEDMLKLAPDQILWLYEHVTDAAGTHAREEDVHAWLTMCNPIEWLEKIVRKALYQEADEEAVKGVVDVVTEEWFENNGETLGETVDFVEEERGGDKGDLRGKVAEGELGVVTGAYL